MSDGYLTEADWKKFSKGKDYKDAALIKALAALEKAARGGPGEEIAALAEVLKQAQVLLKATKGDKPLATWIGEQEDAANKRRQQCEKAQAQAADSDEDTPDILGKKMLPLLREVHAGGTMNALVALAGTEVAVLVSRHEISMGSRKHLTAELKGASGIKWFPGQCIFEANAHTFVLETVVAGLAKKLRAALHRQVDQAYKVRVRGLDPTQVDADLDDAPGVPGDATAPDTATATPGPVPPTAPPSPVSSSPPPAPTPPTAPPPPPTDAEHARYAARLGELRGAIDAAMRGGGAEAVKLRALLEFAAGKASGGQFGAALKGLEAVAQLLPQGGTGTPQEDPMAAFKARLTALTGALKPALESGRPGGDTQRASLAQAVASANKHDFAGANQLLDGVAAWLATPGPGSGTGNGTGSMVALQQARLQWDGLRKTVQGQLQSLEQAVLDQVRAHNADQEAEDEYDEAEATEGVRKLWAVLDKLDTRLIDKLDEALAAEGSERQRLHVEAGGIVKEYQAYVDSDPMIADIDANGFFATSIRAEAQQALTQLASRLPTA